MLVAEAVTALEDWGMGNMLPGVLDGSQGSQRLEGKLENWNAAWAFVNYHGIYRSCLISFDKCTVGTGQLTVAGLGCRGVRDSRHCFCNFSMLRRLPDGSAR